MGLSRFLMNGYLTCSWSWCSSRVVADGDKDSVEGNDGHEGVRDLLPLVSLGCEARTKRACRVRAKPGQGQGRRNGGNAAAAAAAAGAISPKAWGRERNRVGVGEGQGDGDEAGTHRSHAPCCGRSSGARRWGAGGAPGVLRRVAMVCCRGRGYLWGVSARGVGRGEARVPSTRHRGQQRGEAPHRHSHGQEQAPTVLDVCGSIQHARCEIVRPCSTPKSSAM